MVLSIAKRQVTLVKRDCLSWLHFLFLKAFMHSFLGYVVQMPSLMTNFFALFRVARLRYYWCTLVSFPPVFCSSVCVQYNTWKRKSTKNGEGLGTPIRFGKGKWRETVIYANVILTEGGQNPVMSFTHKQYLQSWRSENGVQLAMYVSSSYADLDSNI